MVIGIQTGLDGFKPFESEFTDSAGERVGEQVLFGAACEGEQGQQGQAREKERVINLLRLRILPLLQ